jgi:hypothetical protein
MKIDIVPLLWHFFSRNQAENSSMLLRHINSTFRKWSLKSSHISGEIE